MLSAGQCRGATIERMGNIIINIIGTKYTNRVIEENYTLQIYHKNWEN